MEESELGHDNESCMHKMIEYGCAIHSGPKHSIPLAVELSHNSKVADRCIRRLPDNWQDVVSFIYLEGGGVQQQLLHELHILFDKTWIAVCGR